MQYKNLLHVIENCASSSEDCVTIPKQLLLQLLTSALQAKGEFDEAFYLSSNADIRNALRNREIPSAAAHYFLAGYFEGRLPKKFEVDERYYLQENPDVAKAIKQGKVKSCQQHFDANGFSEGRIPFEGFSLF